MFLLCSGHLVFFLLQGATWLRTGQAGRATRAKLPLLAEARSRAGFGPATTCLCCVGRRGPGVLVLPFISPGCLSERPAGEVRESVCQVLGSRVAGGRVCRSVLGLRLFGASDSAFREPESGAVGGQALSFRVLRAGHWRVWGTRLSVLPPEPSARFCSLQSPRLGAGCSLLTRQSLCFQVRPRHRLKG